ncbi:MAG: hypothetical protein HY720_18625 [Planctomycetes bacterium]|nr:hypothetical protein [Planctomycetota bacterium]
MSIYKKSSLLALAGTVLLSGFAPFAGAEDDPPFRGGRDRRKPAPAAEERGTALDEKALLEVLDELGYEVKDLGDGWSRVVIEKDDFKFVLDFAVSSDESYIWIDAPMGDFPEGTMSAERLGKLLEANGSNGLPKFVIREQDGKHSLALMMPIENVSSDPQHLQEAIDRMCSAIRDSVDLWNHANWTKSPRGPGRSR